MSTPSKIPSVLHVAYVFIPSLLFFLFALSLMRGPQATDIQVILVSVGLAFITTLGYFVMRAAVLVSEKGKEK